MKTPVFDFTLEDATKLLIQLLRAPGRPWGPLYGYEVYLPAILGSYLESRGVPSTSVGYTLEQVSPVFYSAAWELCRKGILRPGIKFYGAQATDDGASGNGYCITPFGKTWLQEADHDDFVPTEPERYGELLGKHKVRFGPGFHERAQQAIRCYGAHAYLACCVMCGAAAESIILSAAIKRQGDEADVLKRYGSANGRHQIENILIGKSRRNVENDYHTYSTLLKYWRDEAAHGRTSDISDIEAYTSLALLLRLAIFMEDNWEELTATQRAGFESQPSD
jgi:hypothetical protein